MQQVAARICNDKTFFDTEVPYITLKMSQKKRKIVMTSAKKSPTTREHCFDFLLYALSNREDAEVQVYELKEEKNQWELIWSHRRFNEDRWRSVRLQISTGVTTLRILSNIHVISLAQFEIESQECPPTDSPVSSFEPGQKSILTPFEDSVVIVRAQDSEQSLSKVDTTTRSGDGHYLTTSDRQQARVRMFTPELQSLSAYCFAMQVYMPDHIRDMIELRWPDENVKPALWTSQALFSFEQNSVEQEMSKMFTLAQQQSNKINEESEEDDSEDGGQWVNNDDNTGAQLPPLDEITTYLSGWHAMQFTIRPPKTSALELHIQHRPDSLPIAIDDVSIRLGQCVEEPNCDFAGSPCPITYESNNGSIFLIGKGRLERPQKIHSFKPIRSLTAEKDYAYIDFSGLKHFYRRKTRPSWMQMSTNWLEPTGRLGACFRLVYLVSKLRAGDVELSIHIQDRSSAHQLQLIKSSDFTGWTELKQNVVSMERFRLGVRVRHAGEKEFAPFVAFDQMKLQRDGICLKDWDEEEEDSPASGSLIEELSCEFDESICSWQNKNWNLFDSSLDDDLLEFLPKFNEYGGKNIKKVFSNISLISSNSKL